MIDRTLIGHCTQPTVHAVDGWRVALFCRAIGITDPVHVDAEAARAAGHPACPAPPTFLKALESEHQTGSALMRLLGAPMHGVLHAEQSFDFESPVHVGDRVEVMRTVHDIFDKRAGAMTFVIVDSQFSVDARVVGRARQTVLIRNDLPAPVIEASP